MNTTRPGLKEIQLLLDIKNIQLLQELYANGFINEDFFKELIHSDMTQDEIIKVLTSETGLINPIEETLYFLFHFDAHSYNYHGLYCTPTILNLRLEQLEYLSSKYKKQQDYVTFLKLNWKTLGVNYSHVMIASQFTENDR